MRHGVIALTVLSVWACKKQEPVQQAAPTETGPIVASAAPSVSVVPDTIASAPVVDSASASASAAPTSAPNAEEAARREALREAREFGMIGLVPIDGGDGLGGIGPIPDGGIGIGTIGTRLPTGHPIHTPSIRQGAISVNGRLPPEVIQRIVRQNFGRFRLCYENGLRNNPTLQGRVATKYIIDRDGSVKSTQDSGSDLPDQNVVQCVVKAFGNISYPQPEGGIVTVVFPLIFVPGT
jgi:hypothetical protein